ncbi:MAG: hypothetical protein ABR567_19865 [Myxococcales bacterium]
MTRFSAALVFAALASCAFGSHRDAGPRGNPDDALAKLDQAEAAARKDPSLRARAGWLRYLIASDPRGATRWLEGDRSTLALCGLAEIAEDRTDSLQATKLWIQAIETAPTDPIAELAGVRLLDIEGETPEVDDAISRAAAAAKGPMAPRTARLLREAAARIAGRRAQVRHDPSLEVDAWRAVGAIQRWRVAGPFGALRLFDLRRPLALDGRSVATAAWNDRTLDFPDADAGLDLEPQDGDVFYAASEIALEHGGNYLLWVEGAAALEARVDGSVAISRVPYPLETPRSQTAAVRLGAGKHQVLVRWSRAEGSRFRIALARGDGAPSDLASAAPSQMSGARTEAPCALGEVCTVPPAWIDKADLRRAASAMLEQDPADALGAWLLARAAMGDDRTVSRFGVDRAVQATNGGAPALALRAQQLLHDPEVPERIGRGRALSDLQEAVRKDPRLLRARLTAAALERESERYDDAAQDLDKAEALLHEDKLPLPARLLTARSRLLEARGNGAGARAKAEAALKAAPGRCDTLQLLNDLSRRDGSLADQKRYAEALVPCQDGVAIAAQMARDRGELAKAGELLDLAVALRPAQPARLEQLADLEAARNHVPSAVASVRKAAALAPRSAEPLRRLAGLLELLGETKGASEARRAALRLAPGDLQLRQQFALDEGAHLLSWTDRDAVALAKARTASAAPPGSSAVRLLDYGAAQFFPDGGGVERVHTVARVLDKKGVTRFGETQVPSDAVVLHLRTLKANGRVLEPESIPEKESVSLPGLEPGDAVEIDYLRGIGPRGPDLPGYALSAFFFRDDETPLTETTYEVLALVPFDVDAHNFVLPPGAIQRDGETQRFRYSAREVGPLQTQPHSPGENETMPWVQIGAGAGQKDLIRSIADWSLLRSRPGTTTLDLARRSTGVNLADSARRIHAAVSQAVRGRSTGTDFSASAAHILAQGRGNRLVVLKATLASAQIASHVVLTRTFGSDPAPYRFPRGELFGYGVLRIDLPDGPVWVDPSYRLAPFGQLPVFARGQDAWVVPEPGEQPIEIRTPASLPDEKDGRALSLDLKLDASGAATGNGRDEHFGFEAASLKDALERLDRDQRKQAVEAMLGRGLRGVSLEQLSTEHETEVGGSATLIYSLHVDLARRDGDQLFVPSSMSPSRLVRRWAGTGDRNVALLLDSPEAVTSRTSIALPKDRHLRGKAAAVALATPFGDYRWNAREENGALIVEESLRVPQQRVMPAAYAAFAAFARGVDDAQSQELLVAP